MWMHDLFVFLLGVVVAEMITVAWCMVLQRRYNRRRDGSTPGYRARNVDD